MQCRWHRVELDLMIAFAAFLEVATSPWRDRLADGHREHTALALRGKEVRSSTEQRLRKIFPQ